jgi:hypothetical protein
MEVEKRLEGGFPMQPTKKSTDHLHNVQKTCRQPLQPTITYKQPTPPT